MSKIVCGLDLSLTATGIGFIRGSYAWTSTVTSSGRRNDSLIERSRRLEKIVEDIHGPMGRVDLVVIEGPAVMAKGGSNWDRAGLWWLVVQPLLYVSTPVAVAAPATVKKFAAGKGTADKAAVAVGMARLWPEVTADSDNEWDALALATMGAQHVGLDVPSRAHHAETLTKVAWPELADTSGGRHG